MGNVMSVSKKLDSLYFETGAIAARKCEKIAVVGDVVVAKLSNGRIWTNCLKQYAYTPGMWPWTDSLIRGLVQLGVLDKSDMESHIQHCKSIEERKILEWDAKHLTKLEEKYGKRLRALRDEQRRQSAKQID